MYARMENTAVVLHIRYKASKDKNVGAVTVTNNPLRDIERCHKASTEIIINTAAIKINGEKIVL